MALSDIVNTVQVTLSGVNLVKIAKEERLHPRLFKPIDEAQALQHLLLYSTGKEEDIPNLEARDLNPIGAPKKNALEMLD
ncbi:hypothetical protein BX616_003650 [Lobosporangium transversale]|uniref:Uncharacterized protein n=1 Tax=Lobosporangium transversale TaxID=64571 RepID=A0A1Y2GGY0_9FUNG|nr:hypothetical protein BCR41DRAFT_398284 [Lobosporangium transversale]KAF9898754.1 hypothetical protein BX616_003650 [Lobosporangium transversale]ORZ10636.1 hypothetical protein BCR41DRAFT_398284 [Lobosporangium transversale]|eukprot:XP_021879357.1 hypothetical protein BCR41DRAFT_398284 [Lobosporangium transversale]